MFSVAKKYILFLISLFLLLSLFASCGDAQGEKDGDMTFTDALGRNVSVPREPQRVAALLGSFAEVWVLAGGDLCAAADDAWDDFGLELDGAVDIGGAHSPSLELLVASDPQLVLASASTASNVEMKDALEKMGIAVIYFDVDCFDDYLNMLDICTDITGRKDLYEKNGVVVKEQIEQIKSDFAAIEMSESDKTVLLLRASSGRVRAKGSEGTVLGEMLKDIGCVNLADNDESLLENLSVERVIEQEPRHIFVVTMGNDTDAAMASLNKMMEENPAWSTLDAVENGRMHMMDRRLFNIKPNARWGEAYEKLLEVLESGKS